MFTHRTHYEIDPLERRLLLSFTPSLLKDINPATLGSNPSQVTDVGGGVGMFVVDGAGGKEVWRIEAASGQTQRVTALPTGTAFSTSIAQLGLNGIFYFVLSIGDSATLWSSNGTPAGTYSLKRVWINSLTGPEWSVKLASVNGKVMFPGSTNGRNNSEPWVTDGTPAGTVPLELVPGGNPSAPSAMTSFHGEVYFFASDTTGRYLWHSDGTLAGTVKVHAVNTLPPERLIVAGDRLFYFDTSTSFASGYELYASDGTPEGTGMVKDIWPGPDSGLHDLASPFVDLNGILIFVADDGVHGNEIWRSDGTEAGTQLVADYVPGPGQLTYVTGGAFFNLFAAINGRIVFLASDPAHGYELYAATTDSVELIADIEPGPGDSTPTEFTVFADRVFFSPTRHDLGWELWSTDGTTAGTQLVSDLLPGPIGSEPDMLSVFNGRLYFAASNGMNGTELFSTDGTAGDITLVKDINTQPADSSPSDFAALPNGTIVFYATNPFSGRELWRTDGTAAGTYLLRDINPVGDGMIASNYNQTTRLLRLGDLIYFVARTPDGAQLWRTDGTTSGTVFVSSLDDSTGSLIETAIVESGKIFLFTRPFSSNGDGNPRLWVSDGTAAGTVLLHAFSTGIVGTTVAALNGVVYFQGADFDHGSELWRSDGTIEGTYLLSDLTPGASGSSPEFFHTIGNRVVFSSFSRRTIWSTDGTAEGTQVIATNIRVNGTWTEFHGALYASASPNDGGFYLWRSDGTAGGTGAVSPARFSSVLQYLVAASDYLYFVGNDGTARQLWRSDGTADGTIPVTPANLNVTGPIAELNGLVYFGAANQSDVELWRYDGPIAGSRLVADIYPGATGSNPANFFTVPGKLFFSATSPAAGTELFVLQPTVIKPVGGVSGPARSPLATSLSMRDEKTEHDKLLELLDGVVAPSH